MYSYMLTAAIRKYVAIASYISTARDHEMLYKSK